MARLLAMTCTAATTTHDDGERATCARTVVRVSRQAKGLIGRRRQVDDGRAEPRTERGLTRSVEPLDENAFVTARQQIRACQQVDECSSADDTRTSTLTVE
jgi:hypothetical protein